MSAELAAETYLKGVSDGQMFGTVIERERIVRILLDNLESEPTILLNMIAIIRGDED